MNWGYIVGGSLFLALLLWTRHFYMVCYPKKEKGKPYSEVHFLTTIALFGAMSSLLYSIPVFNISIPFLFPSFLKLHFDEVPALICGFVYGPFAGFCVVLIKTIVKLVISGSSTFLIGEFSDLILSSVYVILCSYFYQKAKGKKSLVLSFAMASLIQIGLAMLLNVYVLIPAYLTMLGSSDILLSMMNTKLFNITNVTWSYALLGVMPFNVVKDILVMAITFGLSKSLSIFLKRARKKRA